MVASGGKIQFYLSIGTDKVQRTLRHSVYIYPPKNKNANYPAQNNSVWQLAHRLNISLLPPPRTGNNRPTNAATYLVLQIKNQLTVNSRLHESKKMHHAKERAKLGRPGFILPRIQYNAVRPACQYPGRAFQKSRCILSHLNCTTLAPRQRRRERTTLALPARAS